MVSPFFFHRYLKGVVLLAVTENVAVWPFATVSLRGCEVIDGGTAWCSSLLPARTIRVTNRTASSAGMNRRKKELLKYKGTPDRKSTRLNSSHRTISYAVFCLKKKKK